jgi:hypothetical protein
MRFCFKTLQANPEKESLDPLQVSRDTTLHSLYFERIEKRLCKRVPDGYRFFYKLDGVTYSLTSEHISRLARFCVTIGELHDAGKQTPAE